MSEARQTIKDAAAKVTDISAAEYDKQAILRIETLAKKYKKEGVPARTATSKIMSEERGSSFGTVSSMVQNVYEGKFGNDAAPTKDAGLVKQINGWKLKTNAKGEFLLYNPDGDLDWEPMTNEKEANERLIGSAGKKTNKDTKGGNAMDARSIIRDAAMKTKDDYFSEMQSKEAERTAATAGGYKKKYEEEAKQLAMKLKKDGVDWKQAIAKVNVQNRELGLSRVGEIVKQVYQTKDTAPGDMNAIMSDYKKTGEEVLALEKKIKEARDQVRKLEEERQMKQYYMAKMEEKMYQMKK